MSTRIEAPGSYWRNSGGPEYSAMRRVPSVVEGGAQRRLPLDAVTMLSTAPNAL